MSAEQSMEQISQPISFKGCQKVVSIFDAGRYYIVHEHDLQGDTEIDRIRSERKTLKNF